VIRTQDMIIRSMPLAPAPRHMIVARAELRDRPHDDIFDALDEHTVVVRGHR
jgi:hypothetical protein